MRRVTPLVVIVALVGVFAAAPAAAGPPEIPEERIFLLCGIDGFDPCLSEFPAGEPFGIGHGINYGHPNIPGVNLKQRVPAIGHLDFKLFANGDEVEEDWTFHWGVILFNLFVFPEGMTGEVTFTAEWYYTCAHDDIGVIEGCEKPADTFVALRTETDVSFVE